eukprot:m.546263 g.546263  ORF g.546263 m.546263 type:complete len:724 (+) comp22151_c0_seq1:598-2769(+)
MDFLGLFGDDEVTQQQSRRKKGRTKASVQHWDVGENFDGTTKSDINKDHRQLNRIEALQMTKDAAAAAGSGCRKLPPEPQLGNVEYKLKLVGKSGGRFHQLVTQMQWRLSEGNGEAMYMIGVKDLGFGLGISATDMAASLQTLRRMADTIGARADDIIDTWDGVLGANGERLTCACVRVVTMATTASNIVRGVRIGLIGDVQAGKSSLASVLASAELDDGHGRARLELFRHGHEMRSGRTSSIGSATMAFGSDGEFIHPAVYQSHFNSPETHRHTPVKRLVTMYDLAGDPKYHKTTVAGLTGKDLTAALLVVAATAGLSDTCAELFSVAHALGIRVCIVVSKIDIGGPDVASRTIAHIERLCVEWGFDGIAEIDCEQAAAHALATPAVEDQGRNQRVPLIRASSVTGENIALVRDVLNSLFDAIDCSSAPTAGRGKDTECEQDMGGGVEMQVQEVYDVCGAGPIVGGVLRQGRVALGDTVYVGPIVKRAHQTSEAPPRFIGSSTPPDTPPTFDSASHPARTPDTETIDTVLAMETEKSAVPTVSTSCDPPCFVPAVVASIRRNRIPCEAASAGELVSVELDGVSLDQIHPGMAVLSHNFTSASTHYDATVRLLPACNSEIWAKSLQVVVTMGALRHVATMQALARGPAEHYGVAEPKDQPTTPVSPRVPPAPGKCGVVRFTPVSTRAEYVPVGALLHFKAADGRDVVGTGVVLQTFGHSGSKS